MDTIGSKVNWISRNMLIYGNWMKFEKYWLDQITCWEEKYSI